MAGLAIQLGGSTIVGAVLLSLVLLCAGGSAATAQRTVPDADPAGAESAPATQAEATLGPDAPRKGERTCLNLLGEVDLGSGEAQRNENVQLTLIDNNVLKELLRRMGATATIIESSRVERSYFGLEYGGVPKADLHLSRTTRSSLHCELSWSHQNSALASQSFFRLET